MNINHSKVTHILCRFANATNVPKVQASSFCRYELSLKSFQNMVKIHEIRNRHFDFYEHFPKLYLQHYINLLRLRTILYSHILIGNITFFYR